jgi:N-acetylglucosaminyldiphosphoundecaprenol N-acetyl-beta-D-mannosaminyltransferase
MMSLKTQIAGVRADACCIHDVVRGLQQHINSPHKAYLTTFVNPGCVSFAVRNSGYKSDLSKFDLVLPDGFVVAKILSWRGTNADRMSFDSTSLAPYVFKTAQKSAKTVIFVGGQPGVAARAAQTILGTYPDLKILRTFDGFKDLDQATEFAVEQKIDIVICSMGCGAQERFLLRLANAGWIGCGFTCGGYFDQLGRGIQYYPDWIDSHDLRWAYRLYKEPRRLWRRYLIQYSRFLLLVLKHSVIHNLLGRDSEALREVAPQKANARFGMEDRRP